MPKPKQMLDAVKTATSIHNGDYSSLRGKSFLICDSIENNKGRDTHVKKPKKNKYTLNQLGTTVDELTVTVNELSVTVNELSVTVNELSVTVGKLIMTVNDLAKEMRDGFSELRQDIKDINARLDYNNLKKLPNSK